MNFRLVFLAIIGLCLLTACNNKPAEDKPFVPPTVNKPVGQGVNMNRVLTSGKGLLVPASRIIPIAEIAAELGKTEQEILIKDSSPGGPDASHSSCFFKWEDVDVDNAAVLLQIMKNPLGDEYPDYVTKFIESKISMGEQDIEGEKLTFSRLQGLGDTGAYSYEAGKYFWRLGDQVIMGIAFNSAHNEKDQYRIAMNLGKKMTQNYLATKLGS